MHRECGSPRNAFERKGAQFNYRGYVSFNSEDTEFFKRTPGPGGESTYKVLPGLDFDYTLPVNDRFGLVITGLSSNQFNEQHRWQTTWNFAQAGATLSNPYLQQWQIQDGPKNTFRDSVSIKADWKIGPVVVARQSRVANQSPSSTRQSPYANGSTVCSPSPSW